MKHSKRWKRDFTYDKIYSPLFYLHSFFFSLSSVKFHYYLRLLLFFPHFLLRYTCHIPRGRCRHSVLVNPFLVFFSRIFVWNSFRVCINKILIVAVNAICSSCSLFIYFRFRSSLVNRIVHRWVIGSLEMNVFFFFRRWSVHMQKWVMANVWPGIIYVDIQRSFSSIFFFHLSFSLNSDTQLRFVAWLDMACYGISYMLLRSRYFLINRRNFNRNHASSVFIDAHYSFFLFG